MLLAIDCGNTNTVFSIWDGEAFIGTWRTSTEWQRTADQYYVWLSTLMKFQNIDVTITDMIISSTVPRVVFNLRVLADRYFNTRPIVVGKPDCLLPVGVRVDEGTQVGPDRLVNTVAGHDLYGGDLIMVDFGTATTFDVVDTDGAYVGGVSAAIVAYGDREYNAVWTWLIAVSVAFFVFDLSRSWRGLGKASDDRESEMRSLLASGKPRRIEQRRAA